MATAIAARSTEADIHELMASVANDPLQFVLSAYPWGVKGSALEHYDGPDVWQRDVLEDIGQQVRQRAFNGVRAVLPIRVAVSSGRGVGKGALTAWLVNWIMSTRRGAIGTVTANTNDQLSEKTWAQIRLWTKRCVTNHWFEINSAVLYRKGYRESWKVTPASCAPENSEAFQGQHNATSTSFMVFDESSGISDEIFKAAEGGLTDGEPMMFMFFNPTRNSGYAYRAVFGSGRDRWTTRVIDARTCKMPNQAFINEWLEDCAGDEDADFFRVHVRGLPPKADELQFIDHGRIAAAQVNTVQVVHGEPLIAGVDVSGGGGAWTVCRFRRGNDARSIPAIRLTGEQTTANDRQLVIAALVEALVTHKPDAMFIDSAFGAVIVSRLRQLGYPQVFEVNFGAPALDLHDLNMRATMWRKLKEWLPTGAIDTREMDRKSRLATDLAGPGYHLLRNKLVLESKESLQKRGIASPDEADALCWVAGTLVRTPIGPRRIEEIQVGDMVSTPMGPRRVLVTHQSETEMLTTVTFSDGRTVQGKGAHRVYTKKSGFMRLDALPLTFAVESDSWKDVGAWWLLRKSCIAARTSGFKARAATINPVVERPRRRDFYIGGSGLTTTGLFLLAAKSITSMVIGRTTTSGTWRFSPLGLINLNTCGSGWPILRSTSDRSRPWIVDEPLRLPGTRVPRDWRGMPSMARGHGRDARASAPSARAAGSGFGRFFRRGRGFVHTPASNADATSGNARSLGRVRAAVARIWQTSIGRVSGIAVTSVQTTAVPTTQTYNLTVEQEHVYYANGVLVENCLTFAMPVVRGDVAQGRWLPAAGWQA